MAGSKSNPWRCWGVCEELSERSWEQRQKSTARHLFITSPVSRSAVLVTNFQISAVVFIFFREQLKTLEEDATPTPAGPPDSLSLPCRHLLWDIRALRILRCRRRCSNATTSSPFAVRRVPRGNMLSLNGSLALRTLWNCFWIWPPLCSYWSLLKEACVRAVQAFWRDECLSRAGVERCVCNYGCVEILIVPLG